MVFLPVRPRAAAVLPLVLSMAACTAHGEEDDWGELPGEVEEREAYAGFGETETAPNPSNLLDREMLPEAPMAPRMDAFDEVQFTPEPPTPEDEAKACEAGKKAAERDIANGSMTIHAWGYPADCAWDYWAELQRQYGVHVSHHGCVVTGNNNFEYCNNDVIRAHIKKKYGDDAFDKVAKKTKCD